jgi:UDP-glucuronate 4-epimerase
LTQAILVTGGAGFIGSHLVDELLDEGHEVTTLDNFEGNYDEAIKRRNIRNHLGHPRFRLVTGDVRNASELDALEGDFDAIVHLAARAGIRASLLDPVGCQDTNVVGTQCLLEFTRKRGIRHFVFASSSSVYGKCPRLPWDEDELDLQPINPYGSSKLAGEQLGRVYGHLYGISFVALRFFTVYGPRQRPDLAINKFTRLMLAGQPLPLFGDGALERDYTYVKDITAGVRAALSKTALGCETINLGNHRPVTTLALVGALEGALGVRARIENLPVDAGEMSRTCAEIGKARHLLGFEPRMPLADGLRQFVDWYRAQGRD